MTFTRSTIMEYKRKHREFPKAGTGNFVGDFDLKDLEKFFGILSVSLFCPSALNLIRNNNLNTFQVYSKGDFFIIEVMNHMTRTFQIVRRVPLKLALVR